MLYFVNIIIIMILYGICNINCVNKKIITKISESIIEFGCSKKGVT